MLSSCFAISRFAVASLCVSVVVYIAYVLILFQILYPIPTP